MTKRIFDDAPLQGGLLAHVQECRPQGKEFCLILDQTIFFPRGGGQKCDEGTIGGIPVLDVYEEEGEIRHILPKAPEGDEVLCRIDLDTRLSHMQHHTAQHLISAAAWQLFQNSTIIARMEDPWGHIEFQRPMEDEELLALLRRVEEVVKADLPIFCRYYTPEQAAKIDVRGKITPHERIRLVEVEGFDRNACGGTHCPSTGLVGPVRFVGSKMVRGAYRLYFAAGQRAHDFALEQDLRTLRLGKYTDEESPEDCEKHIANALHRLPVLEESVKKLRRQLLEQTAENLLRKASEQEAFPAVLQLLEGWDKKDGKALCDDLIHRGVRFVALGFAEGESLGVIAAQKKSKKMMPLGRALKEFFPAHDGKGGGSDALGQGTVPLSAWDDFAALCAPFLQGEGAE